MTLDSLSDLVLALVCAGLIMQIRKYPKQCSSLGVVLFWIGLAAVFGVVRFSAWTAASGAVLGAHQFFSLFAAVGAFPLLALCLAYPQSPLAQRFIGGWWISFVAGGYGVAAVVLGFKLWGQIAPALSALAIITIVLFRYQAKQRLIGIIGTLFLLTGFGVNLGMKPDMLIMGLVGKTQLLHYTLAIALILLTHPARSKARLLT